MPGRDLGGVPGWERQLLEKLAFAALREQRMARRWSIFFRLTMLLLFVFVIRMVVDWDVGSSTASTTRHTALIKLEGELDENSLASADSINTALQAAFADTGTAGVVLYVNSPGGSPVQAGIINDEIRRLRKEYNSKSLHVVVGDICASGGYYVAAAAERIYVDKASVVGSIGVLMDSFGFAGLMGKLGVERRLYTAGENKAMLDPFSPQNAKQREYAQKMLGQIHTQFIRAVQDGRGDRLKKDPDIFSGLIWTGEESIALGLADGYGTVESIARNVFKAEDIVDYTVKENVAERLARRFGTAVGTGVGKVLLMSGAQLKPH